MAQLTGNVDLSGNLVVVGSLNTSAIRAVSNGVSAVAGTGFKLFISSEAWQTFGAGLNPYSTPGTYTVSIPAMYQILGTRFKVTLLGGGGGGGSTATSTAGYMGAGGGSGAIGVVIIPYVPGVNTFSITLGAGGTGAAASGVGTNGGTTSITYNGITYAASGGTCPAISAGASAAGGGRGIVSITGSAIVTSPTMPTTWNFYIGGFLGQPGGLCSTNIPYQGNGADAPLALGAGGKVPATAAGVAGVAGSGHGSGGSGGRNGTGITKRAGGAGAAGLFIVEFQ